MAKTIWRIVTFSCKHSEYRCGLRGPRVNTVSRCHQCDKPRQIVEVEETNDNNKDQQEVS